jgi:hypothetical protein
MMLLANIFGFLKSQNLFRNDRLEPGDVLWKRVGRL